MFSRTNLLGIVDRLVKKTKTKKDAIVSKKQVCKRRLYLAHGASCRIGLRSEFWRIGGRYDALCAFFSLYLLQPICAPLDFIKIDSFISVRHLRIDFSRRKERFVVKCEVWVRSWSFRVLRPFVDTIRCEQNFSLWSLLTSTDNSYYVRFHFELTFWACEDIFWVEIFDAHSPVSGSAFELVWTRTRSQSRLFAVSLKMRIECNRQERTTLLLWKINIFFMFGVRNLF